MSKRSFWEKIGRGVGYGWQKAKELGDQVGEQTDLRVEAARAREALSEAHARLGHWTAKRARESSSVNVAEAPELLAAVEAAQRRFDEAQARVKPQEAHEAATPESSEQSPEMTEEGASPPDSEARQSF